MRIELLTSRAGQTGADHAGDIIDVPADEAIRLIESGQAIVSRDGGGEVETAMLDTSGAEQAAIRNPLRRKNKNHEQS